MRRILIASVLLAGTALLSACEVGPDYKPPPVEAPKAYKESGNWQPANPNDATNRGAWWMIYNDPVLDNLESQIDISNQNLKAAEAAWRASRALVEESRSQLFPTVGADGSRTRTGGGSVKNGPTTVYDLSASASWIPDLWGRIRRGVESDIANAQASGADLALARLSAQAQLAIDYFTMRGQDELKYLLDVTIANDRRALQIVKNQHAAGIISEADVLTAQTQLESVQAQEINVGVQRAQLEHAIAVLIGKPPAEVTIVPAPLAQKVPAVPAGVPSALLERRPDIASAERQVASANAKIGVAISAWFPDLTLSGSYGYTGMTLGTLIQAPNSIWSFGPALAATLFDAGLRQAQVDAARATYDQTVANYRQTVLTGFQQVEDQLAALRILEKQAKIEKQVVGDAHKSELLVLNQYKAGIVPYSSVLTAQTATLSNEQTSLVVRQNRFVASVALIEALGGGWDVSQLATDRQPSPTPAPLPKPEPVKTQPPKPEQTRVEAPKPKPPAESSAIHTYTESRPEVPQTISNFNLSHGQD